MQRKNLMMLTKNGQRYLGIDIRGDSQIHGLKPMAMQRKNLMIQTKNGQRYLGIAPFYFLLFPFPFLLFNSKSILLHRLSI